MDRVEMHFRRNTVTGLLRKQKEKNKKKKGKRRNVLL